MSQEAAEALQILAEFLARRDFDELDNQADVVVLLGSGILDTVQVAKSLLDNGFCKRLLISGGIGHSSPELWKAVEVHHAYSIVKAHGRPESDVLAEIAVSCLDIDPALIEVENCSTNCGSNAEESLKLVQERGWDWKSAILLQDPTMQRRSHASFERAWKTAGSECRFLSYAPFVPQVHFDGHWWVTGGSEEIWPFPRFLSLVLGEMRRLTDDENGYGPAGADFIDHHAIPAHVAEAHKAVLALFPEQSHR